MIAKGASGATLVAIRQGEDKTSGKFVEFVWEAPSEAGADGVVGDLDGTQEHYVKSHVGPVWTVVVRYGTDSVLGGTELPTREERLHWNRITRSIYEHPRYQTLTADEIATVRRAVDAKTALGDTATSLQVELHLYAMKGVEGTALNQPVVIVTESATNVNVLPGTFSNVGAIYSRTAMIAELGLLASWASILPQETSGNSDFSYGWQKSPPEYSVTGGNRVQLAREFSYGLWPVPLFTFIP